MVMLNEELTVHILSVFNNKLLIATCERVAKLFVYNLVTEKISTIDTINNTRDAIWTPRGNIVYTMRQRIVTTTALGNYTTESPMTSPWYLSTSIDDIIYLADSEKGIYQSIDDGLTWNLFFKPKDDWHCLHVVKVSTDRSDDLWVVEEEEKGKFRLRVYSFDRKSLQRNATRRDISYRRTTSINNSKNPTLTLLHDGNSTIFLSDANYKTIHAFLTNGIYVCQLENTRSEPWRMTMDRTLQRVYVGQEGGLVGIFKLDFQTNLLSTYLDQQKRPRHCNPKQRVK